MGRFRIQLLLADNSWSIRYNVPKNDCYGDSSTQWTKPSLNFTVENYGNKLIYDQIGTPHADMCFSNILITHSVYYMDQINYFKDLFESIPDYWKILFLMFSIKNDDDLLKECGFLKNDNDRLCLEVKIIIMEQDGEYLDFSKNEKESIIENFSNK